MTQRDVVVVGGGHNGLVAACYLAKSGFDVEVIERDTVLGGAVSTIERWPGVFVDRGSTMHVMVRHTGIVEELRLEDVGLRYLDIDPWAVSIHDDATLRFAVDVEDTCTSIEEVCGERDADAYAGFVNTWTPRLEAVMEAFGRPPTIASYARALWPIGWRARGNVAGVARSFLQPADAVLDETFDDERLKSALAWWTAQAGPPSHEVATAPILATALLMHLRPPGRPVGGSGALTAALARRLESYGGTIRLGDGARSIREGSVETTSGDLVRTRAVVAACHVLTTMRLVGQSRPVRVGDGLGLALRLLTDRLPAYAAKHADGMHTGMQFLAPSRRQLRAAYADYLRADPPSDPPLLVMTPTATDPSLAPPGRHVVTVWAQWYPRHLATKTWDDVRETVADNILATLDRYAPGFSSGVVDRWVQTPVDLERDLDLHRGNVMHLDMTLDAMFSLRPLPGWSGYRGPMRGLYLCGASTHPGGGVSGASGRNAARVVLRDLRTRSPRRP